jgi:hypothetical protein
MTNNNQKTDLPSMKQKLLITSSSQTLIQIIGPLIPKLAKTFRVFVLLEILQDIKTPPIMLSALSSWQDNNIIERYIRDPDSKLWVKFHWFMRQHVEELKNYDFDFWLTRSEMGVGDSYVKDCILTEQMY